MRARLRHLRHRELDGLERDRLDHLKHALSLGLPPNAKPRYDFGYDRNNGNINIFDGPDLAPEPRKVLFSADPDGELNAALTFGRVYWMLDAADDEVATHYFIYNTKEDALADEDRIILPEGGEGTQYVTILE